MRLTGYDAAGGMGEEPCGLFFLFENVWNPTMHGEKWRITKDFQQGLQLEAPPPPPVPNPALTRIRGLFN